MYQFVSTLCLCTVNICNSDAIAGTAVYLTFSTCSFPEHHTLLDIQHVHSSSYYDSNKNNNSVSATATLSLCSVFISLVLKN